MRAVAWRAACCALFATLLPVDAALSLDLASESSIKDAAGSIAEGLVNLYTGGVKGQIASQIPGLLPGPYYWWEAGAMFGTLIDYWYYTGDAQYNDITEEALLFQVGPDKNYMPPNQSKSLGNDDQGFWGLAAMEAAEVKFPNPPSDQPQWLALAQAVFNSQALRWDTTSCGGGLKWQIFTFNLGYNYKNAISNGCFFNLASRLGAYTHNQTYLDWAEKSWEWSENIGLISPNYVVWDGTDDNMNCSEINRQPWTYNLGVFLLGASVMWNQTEGTSAQALWETRVNGLLGALPMFFNNASIMMEIYCENRGFCNTDQLSFKAYLSRWMAASIKFAPFTTDTIMPYLVASANAAALACNPSDTGAVCGFKWTTGGFDGNVGVGQQMDAMEVIQSNLIEQVQGPVSKGNGGISKGNPSAGLAGNGLPTPDVITSRDRAGAGVLTALCLILILSGAWWMIA